MAIVQDFDTSDDSIIDTAAIGSGLSVWSGFVSNLKDTDVPELINLRQRSRTFNKMVNSPYIASMIQAQVGVLRTAEYQLLPANDSEEARKVMEFVKQNLDDMSVAFDDYLTEIIRNFLVYGFALVVPEYKLRRGPEHDDSMFYSEYADKKIGWRHWTIIDPQSIYKWLIPDCGTGPLEGAVIQLFNGDTSVIDKKRFEIVQAIPSATNPEGGPPPLAACYEPWFTERRLAQISAVGYERDLSGIPVARAPQDFLKENASPDQKAAVLYLKNIITQLKRNHQTGLLLPSDTNEQGKHIMDVELMSSSGSGPAFESILNERREKKLECLSTGMLAFTGLGTMTNSGSYALGDVHSQLYIKTMGMYVRTLETSLNRMIKTLIKINKFDMSLLPQLKFEQLEMSSLTEFANGLKAMIDSGAVELSEQLSDRVRQRFNIPKSDGVDMTPVDLGDVDDLNELERIQDELIDEELNAPKTLAEVAGLYNI
ncbi:phage portal protein family protein [Endozoicomonas sp. ALB032]|uniref:phage portal protein family protein n=1 Tax=Endozoicomonas sp. ALB032 TaxID=3403082 RepID=UPI003BB51D1B